MYETSACGTGIVMRKTWFCVLRDKRHSSSISGPKNLGWGTADREHGENREVWRVWLVRQSIRHGARDDILRFVPVHEMDWGILSKRGVSKGYVKVWGLILSLKAWEYKMYIYHRSFDIWQAKYTWCMYSGVKGPTDGQNFSSFSLYVWIKKSLRGKNCPCPILLLKCAPQLS